jgi:SpoVK/Ycf46/Vps4 family AAA+-type ATPase
MGISDSPLIASIRAAVRDRPEDVPLRLHLAELLLDAGDEADAIAHVAQALQRQPDSAEARALMSRALGASALAADPALPADPPLPIEPGTALDAALPPADGGPSVDWRALEEELSDVVPPRFARADAEPDPILGDADRAFDVETCTIRLADVGGMADVKRRLELAFLGPLRNPQLRAMYGKSLRGGLLLYGPPGCGKTFLARAVAGEMGARFISLSIVDVLNMWIGNSEKNLHEIFGTARRNAPCVLFLDEIDALGHKRSQLQSSAMRTLGNQLLAELDGMEGDNEGVFLLAATNAPWDVDAALRRPGRLDRMALVLPPDPPARAAIIEYHVRARPIANIDLNRLVEATEHFSGADLAHLCETAAEHAMHDSISSGTVRMIEQRDFELALREVRPSTAPWFASARNVALFANEGGSYDELAAYLKKRKLT